MNAEPIQTRSEDPSSERWLQYYRDARARRHARGPEKRTRAQLRRWRNRQRAFALTGFLAVGVLLLASYVVLQH